MTLAVSPPLYLAGMKISCWHCNSRMPVVAIIAPHIAGSNGEVSVLSNIKEMPAEVLSFIQKKVPTFQLRPSRTAGSKYFTNTCPKCHVIFGDFYLHSEPGAPFFPESEEKAKELYLTEIPLSKSIQIEASPGVGVGKLILAHGKRI